MGRGAFFALCVIQRLALGLSGEGATPVAGRRWPAARDVRLTSSGAGSCQAAGQKGMDGSCLSYGQTEEDGQNGAKHRQRPPGQDPNEQRRAGPPRGRPPERHARSAAGAPSSARLTLTTHDAPLKHPGANFATAKRSGDVDMARPSNQERSVCHPRSPRNRIFSCEPVRGEEACGSSAYVQNGNARHRLKHGRVRQRPAARSSERCASAASPGASPWSNAGRW